MRNSWSGVTSKTAKGALLHFVHTSLPISSASLNASAKRMRSVADIDGSRSCAKTLRQHKIKKIEMRNLVFIHHRKRNVVTRRQNVVEKKCPSRAVAPQLV